MCPGFAGDGIVEKYIDREHKDRDGNVILELDSMFTAVNRTEPGL